MRCVTPCEQRASESAAVPPRVCMAAWRRTRPPRLQMGEVVTTVPTIGFNVETVQYKNLRFQVCAV